MRKKRYADAFKKQLIALVAQGRTPELLAREYERYGIFRRSL